MKRCTREGAMMRRGSVVAAIAAMWVTGTAAAQKAPAIRQVGRLERVSTESLASIAAALAFQDGRVLVNDRVGRRVLLFDSTLAHATVVADTTAGTSNAYGSRPDNLIWFRGDSALLIDQTSLSMFVIGPSGAVARVMAIPRANDALAVNVAAGIDGRGRLVYFNSIGLQPGLFVMMRRGEAVVKESTARFEQRVDSAALLGVDLVTRVVDTVTMVRIPKLDRELRVDADHRLTAIVTKPDPVPVMDAWTVMRDGTIAVLRARDYRVDWLSADGRWTSSPRLPFRWQRLDDARKQALIDSTVTYWQAQYDRVMQGGGRWGPDMAPLIAERPPLASVSDYVPPVTTTLGALTADAEDNLWIRTSTVIDGRPVYDVVNRRGELFDRVQLPAFRTIAGFGLSVIYMAVKDSTGVVRLERARVR